MTLSRIASVGRGWLPAAFGCAILGGVIAYLLASQAPTLYSSRASLLVGPPPGASNVSLNDVLVGQALAPTYAELATTRPILARAISSAGVAVSVESLASAVSARATTNTGLVDIVVAYRDPSQSAALANAIANELATYSAGSSSVATPAMAVTVVDPAVATGSTREDRVVQGAALGAGIGLALVVLLAFVTETLRRQGRLARTT